MLSVERRGEIKQSLNVLQLRNDHAALTECFKTNALIFFLLMKCDVSSMEREREKRREDGKSQEEDEEEEKDFYVKTNFVTFYECSSETTCV